MAHVARVAQLNRRSRCEYQRTTSALAEAGVWKPHDQEASTWTSGTGTFRISTRTGKHKMTEELVRMEKGGRVVEVDPSMVAIHKADGWTVIQKLPALQHISDPLARLKAANRLENEKLKRDQK